MEDLKDAAGKRRINNIIKKCCAFDPDNRFSSAERLGKELEKCITGSRREKGQIRMLTAAVLALGIVVFVLSIQVILLKKETGDKEAVSAEQQNTQAGLQAKEAEKEENYKGRIMLSGWDVTDYNLLLKQILDSCEQKDYQLMMEQCSRLISELYEDEFLKSVETEDTYYYQEDDVRWEEYFIVRLGYEKVADSLAYHDRMPEKEIDQLEKYKYYIAVRVRGSLESTEADKEGNILRTLLYQYKNGVGDGGRDIDYVICEFLNAVVEGIESYQSENE